MVATLQNNVQFLHHGLKGNKEPFVQIPEPLVAAALVRCGQHFACTTTNRPTKWTISRQYYLLATKQNPGEVATEVGCGRSGGVVIA